MKKIIVLFVILLVASIGFTHFLGKVYPKADIVVKSKIDKVVANIKKDASIISQPPADFSFDSEAYQSKNTFLEEKRKVFYKTYNESTSAESKNAVLRKASNFLYPYIVDSIIPYWYGTPWDFNGITQIPNSGNIACGYFVFTILQHGNFNLNRIKLSQSASEPAIKKLVDAENIKRFSSKPIEEFHEAMLDWGDGFYLIGLDYHIGILEVKKKECWFIHSSVYYPQSVVKEKALTSPALTHTSYRIVGKISNSLAASKKWLKQEYVSL